MQWQYFAFLFLRLFYLSLHKRLVWYQVNALDDAWDFAFHEGDKNAKLETDWDTDPRTDESLFRVSSLFFTTLVGDFPDPHWRDFW